MAALNGEVAFSSINQRLYLSKSMKIFEFGTIAATLSNC
jgi:hypothetical protein